MSFKTSVHHGRRDQGSVNPWSPRRIVHAICAPFLAEDLFRLLVNAELDLPPTSASSLAAGSSPRDPLSVIAGLGAVAGEVRRGLDAPAPRAGMGVDRHDVRRSPADTGREKTVGWQTIAYASLRRRPSPLGELAVGGMGLCSNIEHDPRWVLFSSVGGMCAPYHIAAILFHGGFVPSTNLGYLLSRLGWQ